jgi:hypothetical protein
MELLLKLSEFAGALRAFHILDLADELLASSSGHGA